MAPTRTLYVDFTAHFGGAILSLAELLPHLREVGVEPFVLTFQPPENLEGLFPGIPVDTYTSHVNYATREATQRAVEHWPGVLKAVALNGYNLVDYLYGHRVSSLIRRSIRRHGIELVHLNNGLEVNGLRAAAREDVPLVAHLRGIVRADTSHIMRTAAAHIAATLRGAIAISEPVRTTAIERGFDPSTVTTVHNPVDPASFDRARGARSEVRRRWGFEDHHVVAAAFGRVNAFKGQREFLEALTGLVETFPDLRAMIVGDPSDSSDVEYWESIQRMASTPPLAGRVVMTGFQKDPLPYYHASDLVVHSAVGAEGFGRVVAEAMAAGKPVIATDLGGPRDIVRDGVDGVLVPPRDVEGLEREMGRLVADEDARTRMGRAGREAVEERFAPRAIARAVAEFYSSLEIPDD